jgi:hypothetical protein
MVASPGPLTTQPMIESEIGSWMWARRFFQRFDRADDVEALTRA